MQEFWTINIPQINPNEPEAFLSRLYVEEGQHVVENDPICTLETTKSVVELTAENEGYVVGLNFKEGETVHMGDILCYLAETYDWQPPQKLSFQEGKPSKVGSMAEGLPEGLRITQPALKTAHETGIDLLNLPIGPLITKELILNLVAQETIASGSSPVSEKDPSKMIIYGGGGHGKALLELVQTIGDVEVIGFVDDGIPVGETVMGVKLLGGEDELPRLRFQGIYLAINAVGGIGNVGKRVNVFRKLEATGFEFPCVIHPTAFIERSASISPGVQIMPLVYLGSEVKIGFGSIVNTGAIISHECVIGDYVNIAPGAILAGEVTVGEKTLIGMGVTINLRVSIGAGARIGNGATIKSDVPEGGLVRAGAVWP